GRGRRDRARAELLDLDRVGERDHRLARASEHHREREREEGREPRHRARTMRPPGRSCKDLRMAKAAQEILHVAGHAVPVWNPAKVYFREAGITKLELVRYCLAVAEGAIRGVARRPMVLKRYVNGAAAEPFYQKRAPAKHPDFVGIATFTFPSGRHAD